MVFLCSILCAFCGAYLHTGQDRNRGRRFSSCHGDTDGGGRAPVVGHGIFNRYPERDRRDQQKKLDLTDSFRACHRRILLCYYRALQLGDVSRVVPVDKLSVVLTIVLAFLILQEPFTVKSLVGCVLIGAGTLIMVI